MQETGIYSAKAAIEMRRRVVLRLSQEGVMQKDIAARLGVTISMVGKDRTALRKAGLLQKRPPKDPVTPALQDFQIKIGAVRPALHVLSMDELEWLLKEVPEGVTLAEVLVAIARDAYLDTQAAA